MKMITKLEKAFATQMKAELDSWYVYLKISAWYIDNKLPGCAHWMHKQAEEELFHAMKIRDYLIERNNKLIYEPVGIGIQDYVIKDPIEGFMEALKCEQRNSEHINALSDLSEQCQDRGAVIFLQWYVTEQEEEESSVQSIIDQLEIAKKSESALLYIDSLLGKREN